MLGNGALLNCTTTAKYVLGVNDNSQTALENSLRKAHFLSSLTATSLHIPQTGLAICFQDSEQVFSSEHKVQRIRMELAMVEAKFIERKLCEMHTKINP